MLTLILAIHTVAGQMETPVIEPPPPPSAVGEMTTMIADQPSATEGQITTTNGGGINPITEIALSLLQSVLSLL
jgi:hypothetical protein